MTISEMKIVRCHIYGDDGCVSWDDKRFLNSPGKQVSDGVYKNRVLPNTPRLFGKQYTIYQAVPKRKVVGSNPARDAKKRRETPEFSKCPRRYFFAHWRRFD